MREKDSLIKSIYERAKLEYPDWISTMDVEKLAFNLGYVASNATRRCRELVNMGSMERRRHPDGFEQFRYRPPQPFSPEQRPKELAQMGIF